MPGPGTGGHERLHGRGGAHDRRDGEGMEVALGEELLEHGAPHDRAMKRARLSWENPGAKAAKGLLVTI